MKQILFLATLTLLMLTSCSSNRFAMTETSQLTFSKKPLQVVNNKTSLVFPLQEEGFSPNYTGGYDLNFITRDNFNEHYVAHRLIIDCIKQLPFKNKTVEFVYADKLIVLALDNDYRSWMPHYAFEGDGANYVMSKNEWRNPSLSTNSIWRNLIISTVKKRILCVDRINLKGRCYAIVYVIQADHQRYPFPTFYHWNITQPELLPNMGNVIAGFSLITRKIVKANQ